MHPIPGVMSVWRALSTRCPHRQKTNAQTQHRHNLECNHARTQIHINERVPRALLPKHGCGRTTTEAYNRDTAAPGGVIMGEECSFNPLSTTKRLAIALYKWYKMASYIAALVALSVYDGSPLASAIGITVITYMLTTSLRTHSVVDPIPIYGV